MQYSDSEVEVAMGPGKQATTQVTVTVEQNRKEHGTRNMNRNNAIRLDSMAPYLRDISRHEPLSSQEEARLAARIRRGDRRALERLIKSNLRFVVSVARNYQHQGVPLEDLISEGNIGLMRAARKFDEKKNFRFISYAVWWIRQAILQALAAQSRAVKVPLNQVGSIYAVGRVQEKLEQRLGRSPDTEEVVAESEMDKRTVEMAQRLSLTKSSLDTPVDERGRATGRDLLEADGNSMPDRPVSEDSFREAIETCLDVLEPRERDVLSLYFGLGQETGLTLDEVGRRLGITRERVRQLRDRALERLKTEAATRLRDTITN